MIPQQLQRPEFRFCLIRTREKAPFEQAWQKNGYTFDNKTIALHLENGGNYGVICGLGNLVVVDFDNQEVQDKLIKQLPPTFTIKSGGGLLHLYYICKDNQTSFKAFDKNKNTLFDVQGAGKQIVAPGSTHPNGNKYEIFNDAPISEINYAELKATFNPYLEEKTFYQNHRPQDPTIEEIKRQLKIPQLLAQYGIKINKNPTNCPLHTSRGGKCFSFKDDVWHCFHCDKGGDIINLYMEKEGLDFPTAKNNLSRQLGIERSFFKKIFNKPKEQEQKKEILPLSFYEDDNCLYEQVYCDGRVRFACCHKGEGKIDYLDVIERAENIITPILAEEVTKKAIYLPTKAEPYESDEQLDQELKQFIIKWLDIPPDFLQFAIWNIKRSWVYERFHTLNYLRAMGDTGQGKSRFLDTLGGLHYKPIFTSGATTSAPIFRIIEKWRGTLIFDEADLKESEETADIIKIINTGYEKGKFVMRCDQNDASKINFFDAFCPKILATRKPFNDKATESRCVTHVMTGTNRTDIKFTLTDDFFNEAQALRNKLLTWRFNNFNKINSSAAFEFDCTGLEPRVQQIVSSYIAMFGNNQEQMQKFKNFIKLYQEELIQDRADSWEGQIINGIYELYHEQKQLNISALDIIKQAGLTDSKGEELKPRGLTKTLKELGFGKTKNRRVAGKMKRCIPLEPSQLENLYKRYGCKTDYDETKETIVTETGNTTLNTYNNPKMAGETIAPPLPMYRFNRSIVSDAIMLPCSRCDAPAPCYYLDANNRPLCELCAQEEEK